MGKYFLEIEIFGLPKMPNQVLRGHWTNAHKNSKKWVSQVWMKCWHKKPEMPLKQAKLVLTRHTMRPPDFDGLVGSFKPVIDGLVRAGIIENDTQDCIGQPVYLREKAGRGKGKITITVEGEV